MSMDEAIIPQEKSAAVAHGLCEAFGVTAWDDICPLTKGNATSRVFRIGVEGRPYILKMTMRADDPTRHYTNMRSAAEARLAPRVRHSNVADKVVITDFVETVPFSAGDALLRLPATLRALHALPPFAGAPTGINTSCTFLLNEGPALDGLLQRFRAARLLPEDETEQLLAWRAELAAAWPRDEADLVSSHNDLFKPDNILFDGERVWLIDWEAAFRNDRYADLAVVANMLVHDEAEERAFLEAYFGRPADPYEAARLYLMRQLAHVFYTMAFLLVGAMGKPVDRSQPTPEFRPYQRAFWAGEFDLKEPARKIEFARVHWARLVENSRQPRFAEALRIVADGRAQ